MEKSEFTNLNYYHRDLSWLLFNQRVIEEAQDPSNPLLEQLRFLGIASSNLDEFFMVRVPSIQSLARVAPQKKDDRTGWTHAEVLLKLYEINLNNTYTQYQYFNRNIEKLADHDVSILANEQMSAEQRAEVTDYFTRLLLPSITPIGIDAYHAFPHIAEKKIHLFVQVHKGERTEQAVIPLPPLFQRLHKLSDGKSYIYLEQIIALHLPEIFVGWQIDQYFFFRITYDNDLEFQEDSDEDLFTQMEEYVVERKKGLPSRLEIGGVWSEAVEKNVLYLADMLKLKPRDLYWVPGPLDLTFVSSLIKELAPALPKLLYPPYKGNPHAQLRGATLFKAIEKNDLLFQHPYDSFEVVLDFLESAASDPHTIAIKETLYRMAPDSRIIAALKKAALKGKQVTVLVELKARFDEEHNLHWVQELEKAGCYVSYGLQHLKTHSKATLIVKKEQGKIKQYVHLGTGNYNEDTATLYTDLSFFTAKADYVEDVTEFFNYLSGYREIPDYREIAVSPMGIQDMLLEKIGAVMQSYRTTQQGAICFKMNSLTDKAIIDKLYEASQLGVPIDLIVRGSCCLKPGIKNFSETIQVTSIVGRFLEHSRIYGFWYANDQAPELWISSADAMTRNMKKRIEVATPVKSPATVTKLVTMLEAFKKDRRKAYFLEDDGHYKRHGTDNDFSSQIYFMENNQSPDLLPSDPDKDSLLAKIRKLWQAYAKKAN